MEVSTFSGPVDARRWDQFVDCHTEATNYHRWHWKQIIEDVFGWPTFYLAAEEQGRIRGVLPLVWLSSRLGGSLLCSMPFLGECGIASEEEAAKQLLLDAAIGLAKQFRVRYLELRHRFDHGLGLVAKTNKVTVVLPVYPNSEEMWRALKTETRTKIRKGLKLGLTAECGGSEFLEDFYAVFSENMRDLGTPAYSREFFSRICRAFPDETYICRLRYQGKTVAASFLMGFRGVLEAKWSSSIRKYLPIKPNMLLYWKLFCFAAERGYHYFDFGRSTVGSGTHVFKMQWAGSRSIPLHWEYWLSNGAGMPERNPENPKYHLAIRAWQHLPLVLTRRIGPWVARYFP
jgi:serine/alanine adding enzyme